MSPCRLDPQVVQSRLRAMEQLLDHLDRLRAHGLDLADLAVRLQVERVLSALVDLAGAINTHVAVAAGQPGPADMASAFDAAASAGLIEPALAAQLRPSVGLRNVVVHAYTEVDPLILASATPLAATRYRAYVRAVASWLADQPEDAAPG